MAWVALDWERAMNFAKMCVRLDPKCYKAFLAVVSEGSFSAGAIPAAMTVSGVSQHIASIERALGSAVFLRTANGCRLTDQGHRFHDFVKTYSHLLADLFEDVGESSSLQGIVRYAMPPSCILSPHFEMLLQRRLKHPELALNVSLIPNMDVMKAVLNGDVDFGFVTEAVRNPAIQYIQFCAEEYILVSSDRAQLDRIQPDDFIDQRFVVYPGFDVYLNLFVRHSFSSLTDVDARSIHHVSGVINTIDGAIKMVAGGLGISVFPRHCVQSRLDAGQLFEYTRHDIGPLYNDIHIAHLAGQGVPRRVNAVIGWFMEMVAH
jgi:DNA-binding transcriptional LysR family regulator